MSKKMVVQFPSYRHYVVDGALLNALAECPVYDYDYEEKCYYLDEESAAEVRLVDERRLLGPKAVVDDES